jgi:propanol-preferring alcohol dehydrogenase
MSRHLALAGELGANHIINSREGDAVTAVQEVTGGMGASVVLETSGNPTARAQAEQCLRPFGRCCYVGVSGPASIDFNRDVIFKVATIYGSWTFSKAELLEIARFMVEAKVPVDSLITHRYSLDQAVEAFRTFDGATTGKCVFMMD